MVERQGFILSRQWRDTKQGLELDFWLATDEGPAHIILTHQQSVFFLPESAKDQASRLLLKMSGWSCKATVLKDFLMQPVVGFYFDRQRTLFEARDLLSSHGLSPLESDINAHDRFLMERFVRGSMRFRAESESIETSSAFINPSVTHCQYQPQLKVISLDIETAIGETTLYSIAVYEAQFVLDDNDAQYVRCKKVLMVSDQSVGTDVEVFSSERLLMFAFLRWLAAYDPDVIIGWNIVNFDIWFLAKICKKYNIPFRMGRAGSVPIWRALDEEGDRRTVVVPGRVILDGIEMLKTANYQFESFSLNTVAVKILGETKLITGNNRGDQIMELFQRDKMAFAQYNLQDCILVWKIFQRLELLAFAIARSQLTGLALERLGGSVASFDFRYLPLLHREGFVAPNGHLDTEFENSPGGFVMDSQPGIYEHVLVLDFKSLYPSIIRSFKVDPMGMAIGLTQALNQSELVPGFKGAWFAKEKTLLPSIIEQLWAARDQAKEKNNKALSQAIKIIMSSFYGVLGSGGCRFFDTRLASSITMRGHQIIQQTAAYIEQQGWSVIYGDTDSVFVWLNNIASEEAAIATGDQLVRQLNSWWKQRLAKEYAIESALELEFDIHFTRFVMPTIRGSALGSKKRYAGVVLENGQPKLVFKGLEAVRTDWTKLARNFQVELYRRIFFKEDFREYIISVVQQVRLGKMDSDLVYRKRLRRKLDDYQRNIAPHVQAAYKEREQSEVTPRRGDWIEYVMTINGAEAVASQKSLIDYQHYIDRQLAPVADGILHFMNENFTQIIDRQIGLFN